MTAYRRHLPDREEELEAFLSAVLIAIAFQGDYLLLFGHRVPGEHQQQALQLRVHSLPYLRVSARQSPIPQCHLARLYEHRHFNLVEPDAPQAFLQQSWNHRRTPGTLLFAPPERQCWNLTRSHLSPSHDDIPLRRSHLRLSCSPR